MTALTEEELDAELPPELKNLIESADSVENKMQAIANWWKNQDKLEVLNLSEE